MARAIPYKQALEWLVRNDDNDWLDDDCGLSISASAVADIYGVSDATLRKDLKLAIRRMERDGL